MANWIKRITRKTSGGRLTTTFNKGKGTTKSSSYKTGTNGVRVTTSVGPTGKIKRTVTQKTVGGFTKRTTTTLNKTRRK